MRETPSPPWRVRGRASHLEHVEVELGSRGVSDTTHDRDEGGVDKGMLPLSGEESREDSGEGGLHRLEHVSEALEEKKLSDLAYNRLQRLFVCSTAQWGLVLSCWFVLQRRGGCEAGEIAGWVGSTARGPKRAGCVGDVNGMCV